MRINSMKLSIIVMLAIMVSGILVLLFFQEIPIGNREAALIILGIVAGELGHAITDLFKKGA